MSHLFREILKKRKTFVFPFYKRDVDDDKDAIKLRKLTLNVC